MPRVSRSALAPILVAAFATPVMAQSMPPAAADAADRQGVIAYTPADFAAARPNTALDMINRLPGFALTSGDQVRGFAGAAGNVLIDGQRPTIKTDTLSDTLARIPIDQVERIELVRGGATGIDMQGQSVIANVIRKKTDTFQQVVTLSGFAFGETGHTLPGWNYLATRRSGDHQFEFGLSRGVSMDDSVGFGYRKTVDVATGDVLFQQAETEGDGPVHSGRATYKGPLFGGTFSANGLISTDEFKNESHFFSAATEERYIDRSANDRGEIGLNYKRPLGEKLELEALTLFKLAQGAGDSTGEANGSFAQFGVRAEAGESIGRTVLRYTRSPELSFEGGGEVAFNYRDQQVALSVDGTSIPLPASDVRVEELRSEAFVQGAWRPSPKYSFEAGVRVENSKITQSGDTAKERSFVYPKPRLAATWSPTKDDQLRLRIEREVGQLNFQDFASSVDINSSVVSTGNAELEPDKTWVYEVAFEKRFWGNGAAVLTVRREDISDVVDRLPFLVLVDDDGDGAPDDNDNNGQPDERLVSGPGNIGSGANDVVELNVTLPLEKLGLKGGEVKLESMWQTSEVRDPLTGEMRRISGQRPNNIEASFRQDLPSLKLTVGLSWFAGWSERYYRLDEEQSLKLKNFFGSFVEYKPTPKFTLRAELNNFDPYKFDIQRRIFDGPRNTGALETIETEHRNSQMIGMLRARWSFG